MSLIKIKTINNPNLISLYKQFVESIDNNEKQQFKKEIEKHLTQLIDESQ